MASFMQCGHPVHLYVYGQVDGVPQGVTVLDGRAILPEERICRYGPAAGPGAGRPAEDRASGRRGRSRAHAVVARRGAGSVEAARRGRRVDPDVRVVPHLRIAGTDLETAHASLDWAYQHAGVDALKALAGIRLARVELARTKAQDALDLLDHLPASAYTAQIGELRGDALVALNRKDEARTAYQDALANLDPNAPNRAFVQMKLNDLGTAERKGS